MLANIINLNYISKLKTGLTLFKYMRIVLNSGSVLNLY